MVEGLTSIIIPTYNQAQWLPAAIDSALAQTARVEVIVVDDGSTDETDALRKKYALEWGGGVGWLTIAHSGPSMARNSGLVLSRGEFVMFLDADDVIAPTKVEEQLAAFTDDVGWILCDVRIEDEIRGRTENASERYRYPQRELGGWIRNQLAASNFIPVMSPLVRRSVLGDEIRFSPTLAPEDWHFWYAVAGVARVRYLPKVLATYRKRRSSRSRAGIPDIAPVEGPIRLNLGCGTPGALSWHPVPGFVNLDRSMGWCFEDGLPQYRDGEVEAITISHALMYVDERDWPRVFAEFARVLKPCGVIRITEDDALNRKSSRYGGWRGSEPAVTLTSAGVVRSYLQKAGLVVDEMTEDASHHVDGSLRQAQHGAPPDVFFIEGVKERCVLFAPHSDDETLFAAYLVLEHRPSVIVCYPSVGDYGDTRVRAAETREAMAILGAGPVEQWAGGNLEAQMRELDARRRPAQVFAPAEETSHPEHRLVSEAAGNVFGRRLTCYQTYDRHGKVIDGVKANPPAEWVEKKKRALACYRSQIAHPRAKQFFEMPLDEYVEAR